MGRHYRSRSSLFGRQVLGRQVRTKPTKPKENPIRTRKPLIWEARPCARLSLRKPQRYAHTTVVKMPLRVAFMIFAVYRLSGRSRFCVLVGGGRWECRNHVSPSRLAAAYRIMWCSRAWSQSDSMWYLVSKTVTIILFYFTILFIRVTPELCILQ